MCETDTIHGGNVRSFPPSLERALVQAAQWYEERVELEQQIARSAAHVNGCGGRNQEDRDESDRSGGALLLEIMEEMKEAWGFGPQTEGARR